MNAEDPQRSEDPPGQARSMGNRIAVLGLVSTLGGVILALLGLLVVPRLPIWIGIVAGLLIAVVVFLCLYFFGRTLLAPYRWVHRSLNHLAPWFIGLEFVLVGMLVYYSVQQQRQKTLNEVYDLANRIYSAVEPENKACSIPLDGGKGALFNSWDHQPQETRHILVFGDPQKLMWVLDQEGTGHFSYKTDKRVQSNSPKASSGGYMTIYGKPCDRLVYRRLSFTCRATDHNGQPDIGIRLAVDDPSAQGDRERVTYEIPSVNAYYKGKRNLDASWQTYTIDVADFEQTRVERPLPRWVDENTLNKVVFFVSNDIVKKCPDGTLWFRDIRIQLR